MLYLNKQSVFLTNIIFIVLTSFFVILTGEEKALVYTFIFGISTIIASFVDASERNSFKYFFPILICIIFLTTIIGLRDFGIGYDTNLYIDYYFENAKRIHNLNDFIKSEGDLGFTFLAYIAGLFSNDKQALLVVTEFWICLFTFLGIHEANKSNKKVDWSTFLMLWLFTFLNISMNLMRQYCAMSMLLLAYVLLDAGKWKKALIIQILSYFFHSSAIIFLPVFGVFYLSKLRNTRRRNMLSVIILIFTSYLITHIFILLPILASYSIISDVYSERYGANTNFGSVNIFGVAIIALYLLTYLLIYILSKKGVLSNEETYIANVIHTLFFILRFLAFYVEYLARLSEYYFYIDIFIIAVMLKSDKVPRILTYSIYICLIYLWYRSYILIPGAETYPFKSSILGI